MGPSLISDGNQRCLTLIALQHGASMGPSLISDGNLRARQSMAVFLREASMGPSLISDGNRPAAVETD